VEGLLLTFCKLSMAGGCQFGPTVADHCPQRCADVEYIRMDWTGCIRGRFKSTFQLHI